MTIGCSVWMVRYRVHTDEFMTPIPEGWPIRSNVWSIVLGEWEQDLFLMIKLPRKVVQYNLISKTLHEIYDYGSNQVDDNHDDNDDADDELLQQFQAEHNGYEFIPSFTTFTLKGSQIHSLDSPAGLFVNHIRSSFDCDFVSLDPRINSRKYTIENSFTFGFTKEADPKKSPYYKVVRAFDSDKVTILQSCNGLLLCTGSRRHAFDYVSDRRPSNQIRRDIYPFIESPV
nr:hypothetical protein [Tanacetum cinerariifolium]